MIFKKFDTKILGRGAKNSFQMCKRSIYRPSASCKSSSRILLDIKKEEREKTEEE